MDVGVNLLLRKTVEGQWKAYEEVMEKYHKAVFSIAWACIGDSQKAEEITIETFLKVHQSLKMLGDFNQFPKWLVKTAVGIAEKQGPWMASSKESPQLQKLYTLLSAFPQPQKFILLLRLHSRLSYEQISDLLDIPVNTVRGTVLKGVQTMGEKMLG